MKVIFNITDCLSMKEPMYSKIYEEVMYLLIEKMDNGQIDSTKEQVLFLCSKFGAATVTIIPKVYFQ